jgi:hypothetical protein
MAQYEQKIDSREFEVANPEQYSSAWGADAHADATEIAIRLWGGPRNVPLTWKADSVLVYMIADLVGASGGRVAEASHAVMAAQFDSSRQALVAARRIQTSILEFVACRPAERVGAAILIYHPMSSDLTGFSGELVQPALVKAKPGQILLADNVSQRLRDLPGIEFRNVDARTGDGQTGLLELMWTTQERLALLADSVVDVAEPPSGAGPAMGATLIVNSPGVNSPSVNSPITRRGPPIEVVPPVMGAADFVVKEGSATASRRASQSPNTAQSRAPVFEELQDSPGNPLTEGLDEFGEQPFLTRTRVILGVVAVVLVGALIAVLFRPTNVSKRPLPPQPEQTGGTETTVTPPRVTEPEPEKQQPEPTTAQPQPQAKVPVVVTPRKPTKPTTDNRDKNKKPPEDSAEPAPLEEYGGYSQKDIPALLEFAKTDAGKGNYANARKEYSIILKLQPKNQDAKDGLHRLDIIPSDRQ